MDKKKYNVVVAGMVETGTEEGNKMAFGDLCKNHLHTKPHVVKIYPSGTAMQTPQTKNRLLIVTLTCEEQPN